MTERVLVESWTVGDGERIADYRGLYRREIYIARSRGRQRRAEAKSAFVPFTNGELRRLIDALQSAAAAEANRQRRRST
jgi:hypothetical protein